ncbi:hypothetical protein CHS0354_006802 [Potamilus streckersoni]|uniref:Chitin-binding type-2 domain-containing protein n=1 Tax=Potamilus streckersoni TaxID=2493646 RepID=A0AAE0VR58_9BIVA|nr:hypothetical protein CHS0354_006802 [Potamilus streckersoni]
MIQRKMIVLSFKVLIAVLISLCEAQSSATTQQITSNWTPVYDNMTINTYTNNVNSSNTFPIENVTNDVNSSNTFPIENVTNDVNSSYTFPIENVTNDVNFSNTLPIENVTNDVNSSNTFPMENVTDSIINSSVVENSVINSSVIEDSVSTSSVVDDYITNSSVIEDSINNSSTMKDSTTNISTIADFTTNFSVIEDSITNHSVIKDSTTNISPIADSTTNSSVIEGSITNSSVTEVSVTNYSVIKDSITNTSTIEDYITNSSVIKEFKAKTPYYATTISSATESPNVNEYSTINISTSLLQTSVSSEKIDILSNNSAIKNLNTTTSINVSNSKEINKTTEDKGMSENIDAFNKTVDVESLNALEDNRTIIGLTTFLASLNDSVLETVTVANASNLKETLNNTKMFNEIGLINETIPVVDGEFNSVSNETLNNVDVIDQTAVNTTEVTITPTSYSQEVTTQGYSLIDNKTSEAIQIHYVSTTTKFETISTPYLRPTTFAVEEVSSAAVARKTTSNVPMSSVGSKAAPPVKQLPPPAIVSRIFEQKTPENPPPIIVPHKSFAPELQQTARKLPPAKPTTLYPPPPPPIIIPPQAKALIDRTAKHPLQRSQTPKPDPFDPQSRFPSLRELERIDLQIDTLKSSTVDKLKHMTHTTAPFATQTSSIARIGETDKRQTYVSGFSDQDFMGIEFFKPKDLMKDTHLHHPTPRKSFFDLQPLDKKPDMGSLVNLASFSQVFFKPQPDIFRSNPINEKRLGTIPSVDDVTSEFKIGDMDKESLGLNLDQSKKSFEEKRQIKLNTETIPWTSSIALGSKLSIEEKHVVRNNAPSAFMPWDISSLNLNLNIPPMSTSKEVPKISLKEKQTIFSNINGSKDKITNTPINSQVPVPSAGSPLQRGINFDSAPAIERLEFSSVGFKANIPVTESEQKEITIKKDASLSSAMQHIENVSASLKWNIPNLGVDWNVPAVRRSKLDKNFPDKPILKGLDLSEPIPLPLPQINVIHDQGSNLNMSPPGSDAFVAINGQVDSEILPVGVWNFMNSRGPPNTGQGLKSQSERDTDTTKSTGIQKSKLASMPEFKPLQLSATFSGSTQSRSLDNVPVYYENQDIFQGASVPMSNQVQSARNSRNITKKIKPIDWNISFMPTGIVSKPNVAESSVDINPIKNVGANIFPQPKNRPIDEAANPVDKYMFSEQNTIQDLKPKTSPPLDPPPIFPYLTRVPTTLKPKTKGHPLVTSSPSRLGDESHNGKGGICDSCVFVNEVCFVPHDVHCNQYYECVSQGGAVQVYKRECAVGLFFNRTNFLCGHPDMTDCSTDRCRQADMREYALEGHCTYHWSCRSSAEGSYPEIRCCPNNGAFKEGEGCIEDSNCKESCSVDSVTNASNTKLQGPCSANLKMTFPDPNSDIIADNSKSKQSVGVQNVAISKNGTALFYGTGKLTLWRFAHLMFGSILAIQLDFLNKQNEPRYQILLTNCNPSSNDGNPSIEIRVDTLYHEVIFEVDTYQARQQRMKLHYIAGSWNTVTFIYDGERAVGAVNRRARSLLLEGGIETRPSPLTIGGCREADSFRGEMDEIYVYEDCLPHNMISIFQSVLE